MNTGAPSERVDRFPPPRDFQVSAHDALRFGFKEGHKNQLIMAPTGAGKTYLGMRILYEAMQKGKRAAFLCDRTTLINQTSEVADKYGLDHGVIQANHWRRKAYEQLQIASVQTIAKRGYWPEIDVLVVDEAHTTYKAWTDYALTSKTAIIGLSATPFTKGLGKIFTNLINATTMYDLCQSGVLVPIRVFSCRKPDMSGAETRGGEWTDRAAEKAEMGLVGDVVKEWSRLAENRKTIVFGPTIDYCKVLVKQFNEAGVLATLYTSETSDTERKEILKEYRKEDSAIRVLVSVEALAKGFDVPDVSCVCDARPLRKSLSTAIQMWGRGMRCSPETEKKDCLLLDFSGNFIRFFEDFNDIYFNGLNGLDDGEKLDKKIREREEIEERSCPSCGYTPFLKRCMSCGYEKQPTKTLENAPGKMQEIYIGEGSKKKKLANDAYDLWAQLCCYARLYSAPEKQAGRAYHLFVKITGQKPRWSFDGTQSRDFTRNTQNKIRSLNTAWHKKRRAA